MNAPLHRAFLVQVKDGARIVTEFGDVGPDSITVAQRHEDLAESGQFVRVSPLKADPFPIAAARHAVAQVELSEEAERIAADLHYLNTQEQRERERIRIAHQMDVDAMRRAGW